MCHVTQLYVVKLHRKPLFPGIYTPVTITNNERLIREIREKKAGG
jgi:Lon-like ATP-dependent protease